MVWSAGQMVKLQGCVCVCVCELNTARWSAPWVQHLRSFYLLRSFANFHSRISQAAKNLWTRFLVCLPPDGVRFMSVCVCGACWTAAVPCVCVCVCTSLSGQASSILVFSEWQIGCHKAAVIAPCCSPAEECLSPEEARKQNSCRHRHRVWDGGAVAQEWFIYLSFSSLANWCWRWWMTRPASRQMDGLGDKTQERHGLRKNQINEWMRFQRSSADEI